MDDFVILIAVMLAVVGIGLVGLSARFANRVKGKVLGCVTGGILLVLGLMLVVLNCRELIDMALFSAFWHLTGIYYAYIIAFALVLLLIRFTTKVPDYIFRKLLHIVAFTSILPLVFCTDSWQTAVLVQLVFLVVVILALHIAEQFPFYSSLFVEKEKHEVITSFIMLFGLITILIAVYWGFFGEEHKYIAVASIMAWGPGDAAAAIVGRNFGRHKLFGKHIEGVKSVEGTITMGVTSFVCTFVTLALISPLPLLTALVLSLIVAPLAALVELYTKHGLDTVTCPIAASLIFLAAMGVVG